VLQHQPLCAAAGIGNPARVYVLPAVSAVRKAGAVTAPRKEDIATVAAIPVPKIHQSQDTIAMLTIVIAILVVAVMSIVIVQRVTSVRHVLGKTRMCVIAKVLLIHVYKTV
jgi:hypothetical protein